MALAALVAGQAQWVNDPTNNTFIANTSTDAGEIYLATNPITSDTYVQWNQFFSNGWSPTLQRLNFEGVPQWGPDGIHIGGHEFSSMSEGLAMATTTDGAVVSCFAAYDGYTYAVKINADGTFAWGEGGVRLFGGLGFSRAEVIAGNNGGVWCLGFDYTNLYLQYVNANGTTNPTVTISDNGGYNCMYGKLTLSDDNRVFVTYEKCGSGFYTDKQIFVAGYNVDGTQFSPETLLMSTQTFQVTYLHHAVPDGLGGGYVYIWHSGLGNAFNTYVFHFNASGANTIPDLNGVPVHSPDPAYYCLDAYATVNPMTHELLIAYRRTDSDTESLYELHVNCVDESGFLPWGEDGKMLFDSGTTPFGGLRIDAFEYGEGFSLIYHRGVSMTGYESTVEALGFDDKGNLHWNTLMCSNAYPKTSDCNSTGFHFGQNIVAWVNSGTGGLYGQNIGQSGEMGEVTPPTPPTPCNPPTNFQGDYYYSSEMYGISVSWDAPETAPHHYNLYIDELREVIQVDAEYTSYFQELEPGDYMIRLTAVYEDCESTYALTPTGSDYLWIEVTSIDEQTLEEPAGDGRIYTIDGRCLGTTLPESFRGMYFQNGKKYVKY